MHVITLLQTKIIYLYQAQSWLGLFGHVAHHYMYTLGRVTNVVVVGGYLNKVLKYFIPIICILLGLPNK